MTKATLFLFICSVAFVYGSPGDRRIGFVNLCKETIRVGVTGSRANKVDVNEGCPEGQVLDSATHYCFWGAPPVEDQKSLDLPPLGNLTFLLNNPPQDNVKWSGNMWGATGCDVPSPDGNNAGVCQTGICYNGDNAKNGHCPPYMGPVGPVTLAEFTLKENEQDSYDVSTINGVNLPIEMKADVANTTNGPGGIVDEYWCGNPGGVKALSPALSDCSWNFEYPTVQGSNQAVPLTLVAKILAGNPECKEDSDCTAEDHVCGTVQQLDGTSGGQLSHLYPGMCGKFLGQWNANELCTWANSVSAPTTFPNNSPFQCKTSTGQFGGSGDTYADLYGCSGSYDVSGYNVDSNTVCGCPDWEAEDINAPPTEDCKGHNPEWHTAALPWVKWIKKACPTAYTFQFDDKTSSFQCKSKGEVNSQGYTITFCPGGQEITRNSMVEPTLNATTSASKYYVDKTELSALLITALVGQALWLY